MSAPEPSDEESAAESCSFAVPIDVLRDIAPRIHETVSRRWPGEDGIVVLTYSGWDAIQEAGVEVIRGRMDAEERERETRAAYNRQRLVFLWAYAAVVFVLGALLVALIAEGHS